MENTTCYWTTTKTGYEIHCATGNESEVLQYTGSHIDTAHCAFCEADTEEVN